MKILRLVLFVSVIASHTAFAQTYAFKVLINKGKNEVKAGNNWQAVKVGESLQSADEIRVPENAYIGLVHISGKPLELKQAGKYKVADLAGKVNGGTTVLNKYTDFILSTNEKKTGIAATGAVHRGNEVLLDLPRSENKPVQIYNPEVIVAWEKSDKLPAPYIVKFTSMFDDVLLQQETSANSITVNLDDKQFAKETNVLVQVISKADANKASVTYTLQRASKVDRDRIKTNLGDISTQVEEPTAINKYVLAGVYEKNNLLIDAITAYQQAIQLAPDVPMYKEDYEAFLVRNKIRDIKK